MANLSNKEGAYTPGPWVAEMLGYIATTTRSESRQVAMIVFMDDKFRGEEEANARLIASAPELLAALKAIRDGAGTSPGYSSCGCKDHDSPDCCNQVNYCCPECIADAAISKAEGRS